MKNWSMLMLAGCSTGHWYADSRESRELNAVHVCLWTKQCKRIKQCSTNYVFAFESNTKRMEIRNKCAAHTRTAEQKKRMMELIIRATCMHSQQYGFDLPI